MSASMREVSARPGVRENRSASMKREWSNPDAKARRLSIIREVASRPEIRAKRTAALLGHECSSETRAKISKSLMGHEASEKAKAILVEAVQKRREEVARGEATWTGAKLSIEDVRRIRELLMGGMKTGEIAAMYGVRIDAIQRIKNGRTWKGVK